MIRALLYRAGFAGDILMSSSCLRAIKQKHPDSHISYGLWQQYADLIALNPHIDEIVVPGRYMASDYAPNIVDFRHELLMYDHPETYWGQLHAMQCAEKNLLDLDKMESFKPDFFIGPDDTAVKESDKLCMINAWSQNGLNWRLWDKWEALVPELQGLGYKVVHIGAKSDPRIPGVDTDLRGKTKLAQVGGVLAIADLVVAIDSFVAHAAHANKYVRDVEANTIEQISDGTPTVLLAGPIPWQYVVPQDAKCVMVSTFPDCDGPCNHSFATPELPICEHKNSCMRKMTVRTVLAGIEELERKQNCGEY